MATQATDWTIQGMDNPLLLQKKLLDRFEQSTNTAIVDPNNTPSVLMEAFASITSGLIRTIEDTVRPAIYPARANTSADIYKHLSDYDYVDIFAQPATTTLLMTLDKAYVMANAIQVQDPDGGVYYKIVIPKTTVFTIGEHRFGLYYPIEIRCNIATNRVYIVYDTSEQNPMYALKSNTLEYDIKEVQGHDIIYLKIPVHQFEVQIIQDNIVAGAGYKRVIPFSDRFYALRAMASVRQNPDAEEDEEEQWAMQEMHLCVSGQSYDPDTPTLIFTPDLDNETLCLEIPYVYFSKELIRGQIEIEIYTTEGQINYTIPTDTEELVRIDMFGRLTVNDPVTQFVDPFRKMPTLTVVPLNTAIIGGSNGMDFETLRKRVVTGTLRTKLLQTPQDIEDHFDTLGYKSTILKDGVTDRVFLVHAPVTNTSGDVITAGSLGTIFDFRKDSVADYQTIIGSTSGSTYTILPSTLYKFDKTTGSCYPLTTNEMHQLENLTPSETVDEFNNNIYMTSPYYLHVDVSDTYPTTVTYDMSDVGITTQKFVGDRDSSEYQLILNNVMLTKVRRGTIDKYRLTMKLSKSGLDEIVPVVETGDYAGKKNFRVFVAMKNVDGSQVLGEATFRKTEDDLDIFEFDIDSEYRFHQTANEHSVELNLANGNSGTFYLTSEFRVILTINGDIGNIKDIDADGAVNQSHGIETEFVNSAALKDAADYYALTEYKLVCKLGSVVSELDQRINLTYSSMQYKKHTYSKFKVLEQPIYATDNDGIPIVDTSTTPPTVQVLYPKGTLSCMTKTLPEEVVVNYMNKSTYGLDEGTHAVDAAPCVPRFQILSSEDSSTGSSLVTGKYELINIGTTHTGLARPSDVWVKCQETVTLNGSMSDTRWVDQIRVIPVMRYIYNNAQKRTYSADIIDEDGNVLLAPHAGQFLIINEIPHKDLAMRTVPFDGIPIFAQIAEEASYLSVVAYCPSVEDGWVVLAQYSSGTNGSSGILDRLVADTDDYACGYVYTIEAKTPNEATNDNNEQHYVAFLNTKKLRTGSIIPDLTYKPKNFTWVPAAGTTVVAGHTYYQGKGEYKAVAALQPGAPITPDSELFERESVAEYYWKNSCQQYPWDVKTWFMRSVDPNGSTISISVDPKMRLQFDEARLIKDMDFVSSQLLLDERGLPVEDPDNPRYIQYMIQMLQIDAKLLMTTENQSMNNYLPSVTSVLRTHFSNIGNVRNDMFTNTRLFFEPLKSVGYASFRTLPDKTEDVQLDITVKLRLHITQQTAADKTVLEEMRGQIVDIIDNTLADGYLNMSEVATRIMTDLHDTFSYVDILGINGDMNIQTLRCEDRSVRPHLKHVLKLMDDDTTIYADRGLEVEYIVEN